MPSTCPTLSMSTTGDMKARGSPYTGSTQSRADMIAKSRAKRARE